jgi:AcrR family transcriptional regulator
MVPELVVPYGAPVSPSPQGLGRPRQPDIDQRLLAATRALLAEVGYARLTVDAVAGRAGAGKAAIYRRYASRTELIYAALFADPALLHRSDVVDTGSLAGDLRAEAVDLLSLFGDPVAQAAVPGLLVDLAADQALVERTQDVYVGANLADYAEYLRRERARRGVHRLGPGDDPRLLHAVLAGAVYAWVGMLRWEPQADLATRLGALVAAGVTAGPATPIPHEPG